MCMECHRSFANHSALKTHQKRHQVDSKQFSCDQCGRTYILPSELRKHIKRVHEKTTSEPEIAASTSTEVSPSGPKRERRGRPPISAQSFVGTPSSAPIHPNAMLSPQMATLASKLEELGKKSLEEEDHEKKMDDDRGVRSDLSSEPLEDMPEWGDL